MNDQKVKSTELDVIGIFETIEEEKKVEKKKVEAPRPDPTVYVTVEEAATILERSIFRTRQIQWEGKIKDVKKVNRRVYLNRNEVEALKAEQEDKESTKKELNLQRLSNRIVNSTRTVQSLVDHDPDLNTEQKNQIRQILNKYEQAGLNLIK